MGSNWKTMIDAVFLCDVNWKIEIIRQCRDTFPIQEEAVLTDLVVEKDKLPMENEGHYAMELTLLDQKETMPVVIDCFKEGHLVIFARITDAQSFIEWNNQYQNHLEWARNHFFGLYHNEYYLIQKMNNQLVDAQRRLTRSNQQLESALDENRKITEQLEHARLFAEQASRSKTRFLANMSHDIRTPMNAIVGMSELMQHHLDDPEILQNYLLKLRSSSHYLLDLLNDILDLTKIENGAMELNSEPMNVAQQIRQIVTIIRPQITEKKQHLSVKSDCKETLGVQGDPIRLRQVLMNLFSNAVKYTPVGGMIHFAVHETQRDDEICSYQFVIEDNGIGMTKEFTEHVFDAFARAESSVKGIQGTGLGMAITKKILEAMGGSVRVESVLGKGSRFTVDVSFPICACQDAVMETDNTASATQTEQFPDLTGMRFLCAEDNVLNAEILTAILEMQGASCTIYENGALLVEAFQKVTPGEYDAILLDVQMPVMDGYETAKQIRSGKNPFGQSIPIIAMTANAFSEDVQRCLDAGMDAHIAKPIELEQIKRTLALVLEK